MKSVLSPLRTHAAKPRNTYSAPRQSLPSPPRSFSGSFLACRAVFLKSKLEGKQYWASLYKIVKCNQCESGSTLIGYLKSHMKRTHNALQGPARLGVNALRKTWLERRLCACPKCTLHSPHHPTTAGQACCIILHFAAQDQSSMAQCLTMPHKSKAIRLCCNPHQCLTALVYRVEWEIVDPRQGRGRMRGSLSLPFSDFPSVWSLLLLLHRLPRGFIPPPFPPSLGACIDLIVNKWRGQ